MDKSLVIQESAHPALNGKYKPGMVSRINYHRELRKPWEVVQIYLTLRCPLTCYHCMTNSHPGRTESLSREVLESFIDELARLGRSRYICLFGGEPTLEPELLRAGVERILMHGMLPSSVTAATWARSDAEAREGAALFEGLNAIQISTDRAHLRWLGLDCVLRAARETAARGVITSISYAGEPDEFHGSAPLPQELTDGAARLGIGIVITPIGASGRAMRRPEMVTDLDPGLGCGKADVPLMGPGGDLYVCGPGWAIPRESESRWRVGRFPEDSLEELFDRCYSSASLDIIREGGPLALLRKLAEGFPDRERQLAESPPKSPCEACRTVTEWYPYKTFAEEVDGAC